MIVKVKYFKTDEEVCQFLTEQSKIRNLNVVMHWIVPYEKGMKVFYQDF